MALPDPPAGTELEVSVRVVPKGINGTVRLAIDFDGANPPSNLFADLDMIGWHVPALPPPPREAIDWTTPDPDTGQRFTVGSWQVHGFAVEPPAGSARGGSWSPEETRPFLAALNGVLRRHGLLDERPAPPENWDASTQAVSQPAAVADPVDAVGQHAPASAPTLISLGVPDELDPVRLIADLSDPDVAGRARAALATIGVECRVATVDRTVTETYRMSSFERHKEVTVLDMTMARTSVVAAATILEGLGITTTAYDIDRFIEFDGAYAGEPAGPTPILAAVEPPKVDGPAVTVSVLVDPARRILVEEAIGQLPPLDLGWSKAQRMIKQTFRGATYERAMPALRLVVEVAPHDLPAVAPVLADAAGVSMDDPERFEVQMPSADPAPGDSSSEEDDLHARRLRAAHAG